MKKVVKNVVKNVVEEGLFLMEESMPCSPNEIHVGYYSLDNTLGDKREEEVAARIILFSQGLDQWVGVSSEKIIEMIKEDYKKDKVLGDEMDLHNKKIVRYDWLCSLTLGIYEWFAERPQLSVDEGSIPFSGIYTLGLDYVFLGIKGLLKRGMIKIEIDVDNTVLFPTQDLISHIMKVQGVVA